MAYFSGLLTWQEKQGSTQLGGRGQLAYAKMSRLQHIRYNFCYERVRKIFSTDAELVWPLPTDN